MRLLLLKVGMVVSLVQERTVVSSCETQECACGQTRSLLSNASHTVDIIAIFSVIVVVVEMVGAAGVAACRAGTGHRSDTTVATAAAIAVLRHHRCGASQRMMFERVVERGVQCGQKAQWVGVSRGGGGRDRSCLVLWLLLLLLV